MTLALDPRRVAMLREMGLRLLPPVGGGEPAAPGTAGAAPAAPAAVARAAPGPAARAPAAAPAVVLERAASSLGALDWTGLAEAVAGCRVCGLCDGQAPARLGAGPQQADWMVIGEAPGEPADAQAEPFSGPSGQLLDNMLRAIGLDRRRDVYVTNVLKGWPPGHRNPEPQELAHCEPFLRRQVELVRPRVILAMGRLALQTLLETQEPVGRLRGRVHRYHGVPLVVTYHPAYLLRNLPDKAKAWSDLCLALDALEGRSGA